MTDPAATADDLCVRSARVDDVQPILELVNKLAQQQLMLPRSPISIFEGLRDLVVATIGDRFVGCGALKVVWADLAEIRSLAVDPDAQKGGIGRALVERLVADARQLDVPTLFAFTYVPGFFAKLGFDVVQHESLPHKVFSDCMHCPKFMACDEIAMTRQLRQLREGEKTSRLFAAPDSFPMPRRVSEQPGPRSDSGTLRNDR